MSITDAQLLLLLGLLVQGFVRDNRLSNWQGRTDARLDEIDRRLAGLDGER